MSILDKKHILTIDLDDSSIEYSKKIFFYNTDKNISNLYVKIKKNNDDGVGVELSANDLKDITVKLTAIKPKTNQTREIIGILTEELTDQSCAIYKFELLQEFTDQVGSVVCEFELSNASGEKVTIDAFSYRIKESKLTGLNAEIESNPDLPVLKQLIKEVKETAQTVNNIDNVNVSDTKTYSNKKIEEKFSGVSSQIKEKAKQSDLNELESLFKKMSIDIENLVGGYGGCYPDVSQISVSVDKNCWCIITGGQYAGYIATYNNNLQSWETVDKMFNVNELTTAIPKRSISHDKLDFIEQYINLWDKTWVSGYVLQFDSQMNKLIYTKSTGGKIAVVKVKPSTKYTITKGDSDRFSIASHSSMPNEGEYLNTSLLIDPNISKVTVTTGVNDYYLLVYVSSALQNTPPDWFQVEEGDVATPYNEKFIIPNLFIFDKLGYFSGGKNAITVNYATNTIDILSGELFVQTNNINMYTNETNRSLVIDTSSNTNVLLFDYKVTKRLYLIPIKDINSYLGGYVILGFIRHSNGIMTSHSINGIHSAIQNITSFGFLSGDYTKVSVNYDTNTIDIDGASNSIRVFVNNKNYSTTSDNYSLSLDAYNSTNVLLFDYVNTKKFYLIAIEKINTYLKGYAIVGFIRQYNGVIANHHILGFCTKIKNDFENICYDFDVVDSGSVFRTKTDYIGVNSSQNIQDVYSIYDNLVSSNQGYITKEQIGADNVNNPIFAYKFTHKNSSNFNNKKILVIGGTHGFECASIFATASFFKNLCENWSTDDALRTLRFNVDFIVIPVLNPYGFINNKRKNENEVDLNRNYGYAWEDADVVDISSPYYKGTSPFSEKQSQLIRDLVETEKNNLAFVVDVHNNDSWSYYGTDFKNISNKILKGSARLVDSFLAEDVNVPNSKKNIIISDINPGSTIKYIGHQGIPCCILEGSWNAYENSSVVGWEKATQNVLENLLGNLFLSVVRKK